MNDETDTAPVWTDMAYEREFERQRVLYRKKVIALRGIIERAAWDLGCPDPQHEAMPGEPCHFADLGPSFPEAERISGSMCPSRLWAAEDALK